MSLTILTIQLEMFELYGMYGAQGNIHTFPLLWYILDRLCWNTPYENSTDKLSIEMEWVGENTSQVSER